MKDYKKLLMEILELEEDIVRTSGVGGSESGSGSGDSTLDDNDPRNDYDDLIPDFGK